MKAYDVMYKGERVGHVTLVREGLYCRVDCRCKIMDGIFRLMAQTEKGTVLIGVCVPDGGELRIRRKIAAGNMGDRIDGFVMMGEKDSEITFLPLTGKLPTDCLCRLSQARFRLQDGCPGLVLDQASGKT